MNPLWKQCQLGDVVEFKRGYDLPKKKRVEGEYEIISSSGASGTHNEFKVEGPGVVTGRYGTLGEVFYIKDNFWPLNTALYIKDFKGNRPRFISYFLSTLNLASLNAAGAVPGLNRNHLHMMDIHFPFDISVQKGIEDVIQSYDVLIENNNRRIAILEEMAQSLYREWFVKFRFPGYKQCQMVDSSLGMIPEGWEVKKILDFGQVVTGKTPSKKKPEYYSSKDVPFLKTPDMHGSIFANDIEDGLSIVGADSQIGKYIPKGSVCVACIGAKAGVAVLTSCTVQTNQQINSVLFNDKYNREYFYLFAAGIEPLIKQLGSSGATMTNVSKGKFENIELIMPKKEILEAFHSITAPIFDQTLNLQKRNSNLKTQRDLILPKLTSGQIDLG
ncbi:restriction endonuclease subunit S [Neptuniibacter sp. QD48_11]|uniref:restriction endonuclease subunit S n=1 Tax=Neptuniibacter sp. QD48_11 TaxID=3398211 RepID=UPI0039F46928